MKNKRDDFVSCLGEEEEEEDRLRGLVKEVQEEDKGRSIFKVKWKTDYIMNYEYFFFKRIVILNVHEIWIDYFSTTKV